MKPTVKFLIDPEKELEYLLYFNCIADPMHTRDCTPQDIKYRILKSGYDANKDFLVEKIHSKWLEYNSSGKTRRDNFADKEKAWRKVEKEYFDFVQELTGVEWQFPEYECYGTIYSYTNFWAADWDRPEIIIAVDDQITPPVKIAHELFHTHQDTVYKKYFGNNFLELIDDNFDETSLILAFTEKDFIFKLDREELLEERKKYLGQDLDEEMDRIVKLWDGRKDYKDFLMKAVKGNR